MESEQIELGHTYTCASPLLENFFTGKVEKMYDMSALVEVSYASTTDKERVQELNKRIIIPFSLIDELQESEIV